MAIPALLCFDVEPDERRLPWPPSPSWSGFEALAVLAPRLRDELADVSGRAANVSWFLRMDPQISLAYGDATWTVDRYGSELDAFTAAGDELGLHTHCWRLDGREWFNEHGDPTWVDHCVGSSLEAFHGSVGGAPTAYRGGDRYLDEATATTVEAAGVRMDLTLEPGAPRLAGLVESERSTGFLPGVPQYLHRPYVARRDDIFAVGHPEPDRMLFVPLLASIGFDPPVDADLPPLATLTLWSPPRSFRALLNIRLADPDLTHVAFAVRSDAASDAVVWRWVEENLRHVATTLGDTVEWTTPSRALGALAERIAAPGDGPPAWLSGVGAAGKLTRAAAAGMQSAIHDAEAFIAATQRAAAEHEARLRSDLAELAAARDRQVVEVASAQSQLLDVATELDRLRAEVAVYAERTAVLHQDLHDVSTELHRLQPFEPRVDALERAIDELRATRWWRLHERLLVVLRSLARRRPPP